MHLLTYQHMGTLQFRVSSRPCMSGRGFEYRRGNRLDYKFSWVFFIGLQGQNARLQQ
jgi:hypothetical protein